jgi:hypothetical protein
MKMLKTVLLAAVLASLVGCNKSGPEVAQAEGGAATEEKFDLKGMYPGMSKAEIEKIIGKMACTPSAETFTAFENIISQAEQALAQNASAGQPPSDASDAAKKNAERLVQVKTSGRLELMRYVNTEQFDTICVIPQGGGQTYVNLPVAVEISLKNGRAKLIGLDVIGASTENLLDAFMIKYKWADGAATGPEQYLLRMQRGMGLMQGLVDGRNNILSIAQSPDVPNAARASMVDAQTQKALIDAQIKINTKKTGAGDA